MGQHGLAAARGWHQLRPAVCVWCCAPAHLPPASAPVWGMLPRARSPLARPRQPAAARRAGPGGGAAAAGGARGGRGGGGACRAEPGGRAQGAQGPSHARRLCAPACAACSCGWPAAQSRLCARLVHGAWASSARAPAARACSDARSKAPQGGRGRGSGPAPALSPCSCRGPCGCNARPADARSRATQSRADDLRLFVEVLQTFCDDPRDAAAARLGEARAKEQLAEAQRQLSAAGALSVEVRRGRQMPRAGALCGGTAAAAASHTRPGCLFSGTRSGEHGGPAFQSMRASLRVHIKLWLGVGPQHRASACLSRGLCAVAPHAVWVPMHVRTPCASAATTSADAGPACAGARGRRRGGGGGGGKRAARGE